MPAQDQRPECDPSVDGIFYTNRPYYDPFDGAFPLDDDEDHSGREESARNPDEDDQQAPRCENGSINVRATMVSATAGVDQ